MDARTRPCFGPPIGRARHEREGALCWRGGCGGGALASLSTSCSRAFGVRRAQLFYALEQKEQQLEQAMQEKESLEQEVLTARQLSARGGGGGDPKFIEIHHHNDISDDDSDKEEDSKSVPVQ